MFLCFTRYARFYEKGGKLHRTLFKAYGIRYVVMVYGQVCFFFCKVCWKILTSVRSALWHDVNDLIMEVAKVSNGVGLNWNYLLPLHIPAQNYTELP